MSLHAFGGDWTEKKLSRLRKYLKAYTTIFHANERAQFLTTHYVDAFAGSGSREDPRTGQRSTLSLFDNDEDIANVKKFYAGSARIALQVEPAFNRYLFIEKDPEHVAGLQQLSREFPQKASQISIMAGDANNVLQDWCHRLNWRNHRAVVFLDPYGMAVNWRTVETLGKTGGVDLWVLIPVGQAINRMLPRGKMPTDALATLLTDFFGETSWQDAFYRRVQRPGLFGEMEEFEKQADFESITDYSLNRLRSLFPHVPDQALALLNSKRVPLFVLCFASSNKTGARIAGDILRS